MVINAISLPNLEYILTPVVLDILNYMLKMSTLKSKIDYKALQEELYEAIRADELYKLQNDAKIRAVEQRVPTYEHFRQMVNAAHLKPLEQKDVKSKPSTLWNTLIKSRETENSPYKNNEAVVIEEFTEHNIPKDYKTFIQIWKNIKDNKIKFLCLYNIRCILKDRIFYTEIPPGLLCDIINVCLEYITQNDWNTEEVKAIIYILTSLSTCNRFNLAINFMTLHEKQKCSKLFQCLLDINKSENIELEENIISLQNRYKII